MEDTREIEVKMEKLNEMKSKMSSWLEEELNCGKDNAHCCDVDTLANAIHHIAETERNCYEALYYKTVVEQMKDAEESLRMGLPRNRDSMGRYTSNMGRNNMGGYTNYPNDQSDYINAYIHDPNRFIDEMMPMGYRENDGMKNNIRNEYERYRMAKRHYTENGDSKSKSEMNTHAMRHFKESVSTFKDIWEDADPSLKMEMKKDLQNLIADMPTD